MHPTSRPLRYLGVNNILKVISSLIYSYSLEETCSFKGLFRINTLVTLLFLVLTLYFFIFLSTSLWWNVDTLAILGENLRWDALALCELSELSSAKLISKEGSSLKTTINKYNWSIAIAEGNKNKRRHGIYFLSIFFQYNLSSFILNLSGGIDIAIQYDKNVPVTPKNWNIPISTAFVLVLEISFKNTGADILSIPIEMPLKTLPMIKNI